MAVIVPIEATAVDGGGAYQRRRRARAHSAGGETLATLDSALDRTFDRIDARMLSQMKRVEDEMVAASSFKHKLGIIGAGVSVLTVGAATYVMWARRRALELAHSRASPGTASAG